MDLFIALGLAWRFPKPTIILLLVTLITIVIEGNAHPAPAAPAQTLSVSLDGPNADYVSPASWADALLQDLHDPDSAENVKALMAWERAEGGEWHNDAQYNPLNTTMPEQGSWPINSVGVQAFPTWDEGLDATVATLRNGRYPGVLAALAAGNCASCVADAVGASPWGTGRFAV